MKESFSQEVIESIASEEKPNQKEKINIKYEDEEVYSCQCSL